eukprot:1146281-Amphidinium_carterae.1
MIVHPRTDVGLVVTTLMRFSSSGCSGVSQLVSADVLLAAHGGPSLSGVERVVHCSGKLAALLFLELKGWLCCVGKGHVQPVW